MSDNKLCVCVELGMSALRSTRRPTERAIRGALLSEGFAVGEWLFLVKAAVQSPIGERRILGRILPINTVTTVDRSVIWPLSAPRLPAPGPSAGKTFAHELVPKRLTTPNDDPKFASKPIFITISDWSNLERAFVQ